TRQRHRHLALLELLTSPHPTRARTRVIDDAVPVAYCLPNGARSVTVLSQGLLDRLDADELVAVIAHERAHVEQRHDLLLLAFRAWWSALPWFPIAARAEVEVAALVEMLADDHARREVRDEVLARAILQVGAAGGTGAVAAQPGAGSARVGDRVRRPAAGRRRGHRRGGRSAGVRVDARERPVPPARGLTPRAGSRDAQARIPSRCCSRTPPRFALLFSAGAAPICAAPTEKCSVNGGASAQ